MAVQQRISLARNHAQIGKTLDLLIESQGELSEGPAGRKRRVSLGRSYRDAPEVDGMVVVPGLLPTGQMARAKITGAMEYDLMGEVVTSLDDSILRIHRFASTDIVPIASRLASDGGAMLLDDIGRAHIDEQSGAGQ